MKKKDPYGLQTVFFGSFGLLFASIAIVFTAASFWLGPTFYLQPFTSAEVHFTDLAKTGLEIVPASCPSGPPSVTAYNGSSLPEGYELTPGTYYAFIGRWDQGFCISNTSGNTYFIPVNTQSEIDTFQGAYGSLSGVSEVATNYFSP